MTIANDDMFYQSIVMGSRGRVLMILKNNDGSREQRALHTRDELFESMDLYGYGLYEVQDRVYVPIGIQEERRIQ